MVPVTAGFRSSSDLALVPPDGVIRLCKRARPLSTADMEGEPPAAGSGVGAGDSLPGSEDIREPFEAIDAAARENLGSETPLCKHSLKARSRFGCGQITTGNRTRCSRPQIRYDGNDPQIRSFEDSYCQQKSDSRIRQLSLQGNCVSRRSLLIGLRMVYFSPRITLRIFSRSFATGIGVFLNEQCSTPDFASFFASSVSGAW